MFTEANIDALKCFKLFTHPEFQNELVNLKSELNTYNARVERIPAAALPERQRPNRAGKMIDTFNLKEWWNAASSVLPSFFKVLRAIAGTKLVPSRARVEYFGRHIRSGANT